MYNFKYYIFSLCAGKSKYYRKKFTGIEKRGYDTTIKYICIYGFPGQYTMHLMIHEKYYKTCQICISENGCTIFGGNGVLCRYGSDDTQLRSARQNKIEEYEIFDRYLKFED